jgi:hypothetical protein
MLAAIERDAGLFTERRRVLGLIPEEQLHAFAGRADLSVCIEPSDNLSRLGLELSGCWIANGVEVDSAIAVAQDEPVLGTLQLVARAPMLGIGRRCSVAVRLVWNLRRFAVALLVAPFNPSAIGRHRRQSWTRMAYQPLDV